MTWSDYLIVLAALAGLLSAFDRPTRWRPRAGPFEQLAGPVATAIIVFAWCASETWRGLLYLSLMPIGAFTVTWLVAREAVWPLFNGLRARRGEDDQPKSS